MSRREGKEESPRRDRQSHRERRGKTARNDKVA